MLLEDSMFNIDSIVNNQAIDDFEGKIMDDFDKHEINGMHGNNIKDNFGDANNSAPKLSQGNEKLNNPYTFVDKKEFNARP
jgi:hypothetical protein